MLLRHQKTTGIFAKILGLMLTVLIKRYLLLSSSILLEITWLNRQILRACKAHWLWSVVVDVLLVLTDILTIHYRLMLFLKRIDVRQQRGDQILLLLIWGHSGLSRNVLDMLTNIRWHRCCRRLHLLMAAVVIKTNKRKVSWARWCRANLIEQRWMRLLTRG